MKTIIFYFAIMFFTLVQGVVAQQTGAKFPLLREKVANAKAEFIKTELGLTNEQMVVFKPIYIEYEKEIAGLGRMQQQQLNMVNTDNLSAEQADELINKQFAKVQKQLDIRQKYYIEFKRVLTPQQIIQLYQAETEMRRKMLLELRNRRQGLRNQ